jgi:hypothetical protein
MYYGCKKEVYGMYCDWFPLCNQWFGSQRAIFFLLIYLLGYVSVGFIIENFECATFKKDLTYLRRGTVFSDIRI